VSRLLPLLLSLLIFSPLQAAQESLQVADGSELFIERLPAQGDAARGRLLWIPSEYGLGAGAERELAEGLAGQGFEVWLVDLHSSFFLAPGRSSLMEVPLEAVVGLIDVAQPDRGRLYLFSYGRGAALALMAARRWREEHPQAGPLGGALLIHPNLLAATPEAGAEASYLPIASQSNLPIYLLQPRNSAKFWYLQDLVAKLEAGGSSVFVQPLPGVTDGYQVRNDATPFEREARKSLPRTLAQGARLLGGYNRQARAPAVAAEVAVEWRAGGAAGLAPYQGEPTPPTLVRQDLSGQTHNLEAYRGQVVLVNFWATWCPPCVKEIPSMGRLQQRLKARGFTILAVDVGDSRAQVEAFLEQVPAHFPVLLDPQGELVEAWQVRAFPTNFIIDREGRIRLAFFGALEWDSPEVLAQVESLL